MAFILGKSDGSASKREQNKTSRWIVTVFLITIVISSIISFLSEEMLSGSGMVMAFVVLLAIVALGICFDILGVAVTSADERPFHSMAARKVPGAQEAIRLLRSAERVSSICNDVVGDICGVVSGSASAAIAGRLVSNFQFTFPNLVTLLMSAMIAGLTVGGKAAGKAYAIHSCTQIVHSAGKALAFFNRAVRVFRKK